MAIDPSVDSTELFAPLVLDELRDLVESGFAVVESTFTTVVLAKGEIQLHFYWGRASHEVGAGITLGDTRYSLSELMRLVDPGVATTYRNPTATSAEVLPSVVKRVTALFRKYATPALQNAQVAATRLRKQRYVQQHVLALESRARVVRPAAEVAFRLRNYSKAAELYEEIEEVLTAAEHKKLTYARSRSGSRH